MAVLTVLYLKRERLGLSYENTLALADEIARYISNFQRIEAEVILEVNTTLWNKGGRRALGHLSVQQLLDIMEAAQHASVEEPFVDELYKELRRKLTQEQENNR
ncbi:hypothetical protein PAT3040_02196 [Paenibacillus agaridevorans]|uniref:Uncharacterized protein n=2 Tax=Paenibacillus agaridevorans TaxID=171404 RepID=A0A2R5ELV1_9BACL|nr:hypothetical protein PAT3040_02196 [Paenibacillus agaridevorans]